ncbi:hypothetical protein QBC36DRAFT_86841 [Triangularia setosa]|uniref:Uncharacterized protein n=1 Tax=Triangularia setosa TaxID=2587417 RepID=A0AAN7A2M4_9PEZI|nr:hypothetical protein QBC36DRAFT_86841 [Podospora setosa]
MTQNITIIDTSTRLSALLNDLVDLLTNPPSLCVDFDLEGGALSRCEALTILTIHVHPTNRTYLVEVYTLQSEAFFAPVESNPETTMK